jgi:hypothetical protein
MSIIEFISSLEGRKLGGALDLDELAAPGHDEVHVDIRARVLLVGKKVR